MAITWTTRGKQNGKIEDLTDEKFGLLQVLFRSGSSRDGCGYLRTNWTVRCMCGETFTTRARYLKRGTRNHCGKALCKMFYDRSPK